MLSRTSNRSSTKRVRPRSANVRIRTDRMSPGLKAADQILKKNPNHGDTEAMKALILNSLGQTEEAFALAKTALKDDMKSHVCWHVYGILWRSVKNNEEAIKAYRFALKLEPDSPQVLRDLALLQIQTRDYQGYIQSRNLMLQQRSSLRLNWTALAIAHHLAEDFKSAENVLNTYEGTLKHTPSKGDIEHAEAVLYKNMIIAESGDVQRALEHLDTIYQTSPDRTAVMELRAKYLLQLDKKEEAEKAYRALLDRNAEYRAYYEGLEKALGLDKSQKQELKELYASYANKNDRIDAARRIPLDFLEGEDFKEAADSYLRAKLHKGVPSTFNNVKSLYADASKLKTIEGLVEGYQSEGVANGDATGATTKKDSFHETTLYFLAQHYNYKLSRDLKKAMQYVDKLIELSPKTYDYHMTKARVLKHSGNISEASKAMSHARELDIKDRYINTKCAKYQLRNDENADALATMSKFTRNEVVGGTLGDLTDMQSLWYLTEDGEAYARRSEYGLALKRFHTVFDIFDVWQEDQFDFHSFSLRKGQIRAYVDTLRWEDRLRSHPFYKRIAVDAIKVYLALHDRPILSQETATNGVDPTDAKAIKKAKKEAERREREDAERREAERKAAAAKKANATADGETKKPDEDPNGKKLRETKEPLAVATRFLAPLLEFGAADLEVQHLGFEVYLRKGKFFLALKSLLAAFTIAPEDPTAHAQAVRFRQACKPLDENKAVLDLASSSLPAPFNDAKADLASHNEAFVKQHADSPRHVYNYARALKALDPSSSQGQKTILEVPDRCKDVNLAQGLEGIALLRELGSEKASIQAFAKKLQDKWPAATILEREASR
ncbi:hypothetical protein FH972_022121 [Carpinus fangiana]|uniref:Uncharacterized protein n=1 Tax=Carpinus fangiana TaxID=176857 RepID=A0A5N6KRB2_9ROSI|nr:hypothetical protein FH972_022121 [Carpinus fangiana]